MRRVVLFCITNMAVMLLFGMAMLFMNIQFCNLVNLMMISGIIGFFGSIISLLISKHVALFSVNGEILERGKGKIEDWLLETVYNQSCQLGIVMPQVAIYCASDMNAFATGARRNSALIAVSTGILRNMKTGELEAVIAHEMSHIFNGDMVTITLIQGVINTFVIFISRFLANCILRCISFVASSNLLEDSDNGDNFYLESKSSVYFFIAVILELIFGVLANILVLWFSRYREFYADAGSAKLVGRDKMIAALEKLKLSSNPEESKIISPFCINGCYDIDNMFSKLFMSHPSLEDRIEALRKGYYLY